jgi:hypothetical protein
VRPQAPRLLAAYYCWFEQALAQSASDPGESSRLAAEATDLLRWAKAAVCAGRAHAQARLSRADHASRYLPARQSSPLNWRLQA